MKTLILLVFSVLILLGGEAVKLEDKYKKSTNCISCHGHIVKEWMNSWHAASHYNKDEYFRKTLDYLGRKERRSINAIKIECATCHNPRISVTSTGVDYEIMAVMGLDKDSAVTKALADDAIAEGINCVVCHNIDQVDDSLPESKRGIHRVTWMKAGIMSGPYNDAKSPYHKVKQRDFMDTNPNKLCFVCHANDKTMSGHLFINMKQEYKKSSKKCVDCHMSPRHDGYASTLPIDKGKPKKRIVRRHGFEGAHMKSMLEGSLDLNLVIKDGTLDIHIINENPHNIPSGFGGRELIIEAAFSDVAVGVTVETRSLTQHYRSKREKITIPHLSVKASNDNSIPAMGERVISFKIPQGANAVNVKIYYRLVNDKIRKLLDLKEPRWSEKTLINQRSKRL